MGDRFYANDAISIVGNRCSLPCGNRQIQKFADGLEPTSSAHIEPVEEKSVS